MKRISIIAALVATQVKNEKDRAVLSLFGSPEKTVKEAIKDVVKDSTCVPGPAKEVFLKMLEEDAVME
jgi:hypothetical protein